MSDFRRLMRGATLTLAAIGAAGLFCPSAVIAQPAEERVFGDPDRRDGPAPLERPFSSSNRDINDVYIFDSPRAELEGGVGLVLPTNDMLLSFPSSGVVQGAGRHHGPGGFFGANLVWPTGRGFDVKAGGSIVVESTPFVRLNNINPPGGSAPFSGNTHFVAGLFNLGVEVPVGDRWRLGGGGGVGLGHLSARFDGGSAEGFGLAYQLYVSLQRQLTRCLSIGARAGQTWMSGVPGSAGGVALQTGTVSNSWVMATVNYQWNIVRGGLGGLAPQNIAADCLPELP